MPHPLPALAAVLAAPLLGLAAHAASIHAASTHATDRPPATRAAMLPNNLCASCHGGGRVASLGGDALGARDLLATRAYLPDAPRG